jgi:hypothetical protein
MKPDIRDLYEHIGNLFYAIGTDQRMHLIEVPELKKIVSNYWLPRHASPGYAPPISWEGHCMLLTIDSLVSDAMPAREAYRDFEKFFMVYPEVFSNELKHIVFETAKDIVETFGDRNKYPEVSLDELHELLYPTVAEPLY